MGNTTVFKDFATRIEDKPLHTVLEEIKSGKYKDFITPIRMAIGMGKDSRADELKKQLLAFTPSATFANVRKKEKYTAYSGFVHLDFDKLEPEELNQITETVKKTPFTYACFTSPSGNGLKVFIQVDSGGENHETAYLQVQEYFERILNVKADPKCKDISRLCFVSYDEEMYLNSQAECFAISLQKQPVLNAVQETKEVDYSKLLADAVSFTNKKETYVNGNRNNYIHLLACNCNRKGIPQNDAESFVLSTFQHENQKELLKSVESAYKNNIADFATFANVAEMQNCETPTQATEDYLKSTPLIPESVYQTLPDIIKRGTDAFFDDLRKRDVFLTGALTILSGCLPNVQGVYGGERVYPHLFSFIIAPAANGKGVMKNAKRLADKIHEKLLAESKIENDKHEQEMIEYKNQLADSKKTGIVPQKPEEPKFRLLFIPANTSQAMMMELLQHNEGKGIICETEADTMSGTKKQDWGDYSPIIRGAFHHEKISTARKTNHELIEVPEPRLAICLSGTPAQVPKLIGSAEDGLFSRFIFYAFRSDIIWQDPSPRSKPIVYNELFGGLSNEILELNEFLSQTPTEVCLTDDQWDILNATFAERLSDVTLLNSEDSASIVYRLGLITYRICMIFTAFRKRESAEDTKNMFCTDDDFLAALSISEIYLEHSLLMFKNLNSNEEKIEYSMPNNKRLFLQKLPVEFSRKEAVEIGKKLQLSERTIDDFLKKSVPSLLEKVKTGHYKKVHNHA